MSILGNRVIRTEDPHLLTGGGGYVDSLDLPGARVVTFARSTVPHALVRSVDVSAARAMPGVEAVFAAHDLDLGPFPPPNFFPQIDQRFHRWPLANDRVRFVGEPIAVIVSEHRYQGADAADAVVAEYEPLPVLLEMKASAAGDILLFPDVGTNVAASLDLPPVEGLFDGADEVVTLTMINRRMAPAPMEGRACAAAWDGTRLTCYASTQGIAATKMVLAATFGLDSEAVRVVAADVGGGFGSKGGASQEELLVAWLALRLGGTVRWAETRSENLLAMTHGRGQVQTVEVGATRDGRIVGLHMDIVQEAGAYPDIGSGLPVMTMLMSSGVYRIPKIAFTSKAYLTNTTPVGAFRGAGRPEAAYAIERTLDVLARRLALDPVEIRRRNFIAKGSFPVTTSVGTVYDTGDYETALDRALAAAGYEALRAEQARRRADGSTMLLGIGLSCYVEITGAMPGAEPARIEINRDGSAIVYTGSTPHGQGHLTTWAMVASDRLGIPIERIEVVYGDTDRVPVGGVTGGSRSAQVCGVVVGRAADAVAVIAKRVAAELLEAAPDDIVLDTDGGRFHVAGAPAVAKTWADVAAAATESLRAEEAFEAASPTFPFGANVAVVEVDTETGRVEVLRLVGCDDAGTLLNPLLAEGQLHGGFAAGIAQALLEEIVYDDGGNPLTSSFTDYAAVTAAELPSFELVHMATPTPINELGAKGIGESGAVGSTPCVVNAVVDALAHLGVEHIDMPTTPARVWAAMQSVPTVL
ncbi:MAG TPA: xanthine dehydrogenase family protein molybdopterin-binding subunit [Acidimicrobiales bacterium]|nr:xanthine dehydrogenase family protein molybdopterin-binding subunit [Acidimicrobiales bacterium]